MKKNVRKIITVALVATFTVTGATAASAEEAPVKDGWQWLMPDSATIGTCKDGYRPIWSEVPGHDTDARYWVGYGWQHADSSYSEGWAPDAQWVNSRINNLTWEQLQGWLAEQKPSQATVWGYMFNNGYEKVTTEPVGGKLYEGDCILTTHEIPGGENDGGGGVIQPIPTPEPTPEPPTEGPVTPPETTTPPAPQDPTTPPAPPVTTPPVVAKPKPVITKRLVQRDTYRVTSRAEKTKVLGMALDGVLKYREDKDQWGDSTWQIVEQTLTNGRITSQRIVREGGNGNGKPGERVTMLWFLGKGATVNAPWGSNGKVDQVFYTVR